MKLLACHLYGAFYRDYSYSQWSKTKSKQNKVVLLEMEWINYDDEDLSRTVIRDHMFADLFKKLLSFNLLQV